MKKHEQLVLYLVKHPFADVHVRGLEKELKISAAGISKIIKEEEREDLVQTENIGKAVIPKFIFSEKGKLTAEFLIMKEREDADPYLRRWSNELKEIKNANIILLFGSVLRKGEKANDIDVVFVTTQKQFKELEKEIESKNSIGIKRIHPIYQTIEDLKRNLNKKDKIVIAGIEGIIVRGEKELIKVLEEVRK